MRILYVVGTRPNFVKTAPVIGAVSQQVRGLFGPFVVGGSRRLGRAKTVASVAFSAEAVNAAFERRHEQAVVRCDQVHGLAFDLDLPGDVRPAFLQRQVEREHLVAGCHEEHAHHRGEQLELWQLHPEIAAEEA